MSQPVGCSVARGTNCSGRLPAGTAADGRICTSKSGSSGPVATLRTLPNTERAGAGGGLAA